MSFLNAAWRKLAIANYIVDKDVLTNHLPAGTELDLWEGNCYISLVGFMFVNTKILGIKIPFHINFEEVNLRFYVKRFENGEWKRGVVFIKEIVANTVYGEHYETLPMEHVWKKDEHQSTVEYKWKKNKVWNSIKIEASLEMHPIYQNSETEFITEHYWGYSKVNQKKSNEYEVTHPKWEAYKVNSYAVDVHFGGVYGDEFAFINTLKPSSVMLAEGSEITVEGKRTIKLNG